MKSPYIAHVEVQNDSKGWDTWERIAMLTEEQAHECRAHGVCIIGIIFPDKLMTREGGRAIFLRDAWIRPVKLPKRRWWQFWRKG